MQMKDGSVEKAIVYLKDKENYDRLIKANKGTKASFSGIFDGIYPVFREVEVNY